MEKEEKVEWENLDNMENSDSERSEEQDVQGKEVSCEGKKVQGKGSSSSESHKIELSLSGSLYRKLLDKSKKEGVSFNELASELLAEGIVLRAWEIMERKNAMKGPNSSPQGQQRNPRQNYNRNNSNNNNYSSSKGKYRSGGNNFQGKPQKKYNKFSGQDMGDNANFIEYVRSQEKKNPW